MCRVLTLFVLFFASISARAQFRVKFVLVPDAHTATGNIFLAGSFNNWNPKSEAHRFVADTLTIFLDAGTHAFKLTQGSWDKVEVDQAGRDIANRDLIIKSDTVIRLSKPGFKSSSNTLRASTACSHVMVFDSAMFMPQLNRYRHITVHLPPDYSSSNKRYPVLYVHDGQNVFDAARAPFGEWKMDESLDSLYAATGWNPIIVAVDHGGEKRVNEYNTNNHSRFGAAEGKAYLTFITKTLKPAIDSAFRTSTGRRQTWLAGSSMGGVISTGALLYNSNTFGGAGIFSPAYWTSPAMFEQMSSKRFTQKTYAFVYAGAKEDSSMVPLARQMNSSMKTKRRLRTEFIVDEGGLHNEKTWARYFPLFLNYMRKRSD